MTQSSSAPKNQAQTLLTEVAVAAVRQIETDTQRKMAQCQTDADIARVFELPEPLTTVDQELMPVRIALKQMSSLISTAFMIDPEQIVAHGAATPRSVVMERSAEGQLAYYFNKFDSALLEATLAPLGALESLQDTKNTISLFLFPDQSMIGNLERTRPGHNLFSDLCDHAQRLEQIALENHALKDPVKMRNNFDEIRESMTRDLELAGATSEPTIRLLPAVFERAMIDMFKMEDAKNELSDAYANAAEFMESTKAFQDDSGAWAPGVKVSIDGEPCPEPRDLAARVGALPPLTLDRAIERLRQSREVSQTQAAAPSPAAPKAP